MAASCGAQVAELLLLLATRQAQQIVQAMEPPSSNSPPDSPPSGKVLAWKERLLHTDAGRELSQHLADVKYRSGQGGYEAAVQQANSWHRVFVYHLNHIIGERYQEGRSKQSKSKTPIPFGLPEPPPNNKRQLPKVIAIANLSGKRRLFFGDDYELMTDLCAQSRTLTPKKLNDAMSNLIQTIEDGTVHTRSLLVCYSLPWHAGMDGAFWSVSSIDIESNQVIDRAATFSSMSAGVFTQTPSLSPEGEEVCPGLIINGRHFNFISARTVEAFEAEFRAVNPAPAKATMLDKMHVDLLRQYGELSDEDLAKHAKKVAFEATARCADLMDGFPFVPNVSIHAEPDSEAEKLLAKERQDRKTEKEHHTRLMELLKQKVASLETKVSEQSSAHAKVVTALETKNKSLEAEVVFLTQQASSAVENTTREGEKKLFDLNRYVDSVNAVNATYKTRVAELEQMVSQQGKEIEGFRRQQSASDKIHHATKKQQTDEIKRLVTQVEDQNREHNKVVKELKEKHAHVVTGMKASTKNMQDTIKSKEQIVEQLGQHLSVKDDAIAKLESDHAESMQETQRTLDEISKNHQKLTQNYDAAIKQLAKFKKAAKDRAETAAQTEPHVDEKVILLETEVARLYKLYEQTVGAPPPQDDSCTSTAVGTGPTDQETTASQIAPVSTSTQAPTPNENVALQQPPQQQQPAKQPQVPIVDAELSCMAAMQALSQLVEWTRHLNAISRVTPQQGFAFPHAHLSQPQPQPQPQPQTNAPPLNGFHRPPAQYSGFYTHPRPR